MLPSSTLCGPMVRTGRCQMASVQAAGLARRFWSSQETMAASSPSVVAGSALAVKHDYVPASRIVAVIAVTAAAATWLERGLPIAERAIVTGCAALVIIVVAGRRPGAVNVRLRLT